MPKRASAGPRSPFGGGGELTARPKGPPPPPLRSGDRPSAERSRRAHTSSHDGRPPPPHASLARPPQPFLATAGAHPGADLNARARVCAVSPRRPRMLHLLPRVGRLARNCASVSGGDPQWQIQLLHPAWHLRHTRAPQRMSSLLESLRVSSPEGPRTFRNARESATR